MIKKIDYIEAVANRVAGEMTTDYLGSLHERAIETYLGRAFNTSMLQVYRTQRFNMDNYAKRYFDISIDYDAGEELYYSMIPASYIQIPRVAGGVWKVQQMKNRSMAFEPMKDNEVELTFGQDLNLIDDVIGYTVLGMKIYYYGMTAPVAEGTVKMDLIIPFEEYDYEDYVPIPSGTDMDIMGMTLNMLQGKPMSDQITNNQIDNK